MRGSGRTEHGSGRNAATPGLISFSSDSLPPADRLAQWQDIVGRTLTGCNSSPLDTGDFSARFQLVTGSDVRIGMTRLRNVHNNRDRTCLRDQDDDLIFFSLLGGTATIDHNGERIRLKRGDGVLAQFHDTLDTTWPDANLMLIRINRAALRGQDLKGVAGRLQPGADPLVRLLRSYTLAVWREASVSGAITPIADRHITELVAAICSASTEDATARARGPIGAARVEAMREALRRGHANPCLTMQQVAAAVGISERAGYLAFEDAGLNFTRELQAVRLDRARERLLVGRERVIDIAYSVGFSDASHFHRSFRDRFGRTPGDSRLAS